VLWTIISYSMKLSTLAWYICKIRTFLCYSECFSWNLAVYVSVLYTTFDHATFYHSSSELITANFISSECIFTAFTAEFFPCLSYRTTQIYWYILFLHLFSFLMFCFILCHFVFPNSCKTLIVKGSYNSTVYNAYVLGFWTGYCLKEHCVAGNGSVPIRRWRNGPLVENDSFCHTQQNSYLPILPPGVCHELIQFLKHSNSFWISDSGRSLRM